MAKWMVEWLNDQTIKQPNWWSKYQIMKQSKTKMDDWMNSNEMIEQSNYQNDDQNIKWLNNRTMRQNEWSSENIIYTHIYKWQYQDTVLIFYLMAMVARANIY